MDAYQTLKQKGTSEYIEKKSRFIGVAVPVQTEQQALSFLQEVKKQYPDARHHVYAYMLRQDNKQRYSDDGEPQGTAGLPVLEILKNQNLTDCAIVVTRYFGGTLLGTGGLVRAYSTAAKEAVEASQIVTASRAALCSVQCDYRQYSLVQSVLLGHSAVLTQTDFLDTVQMRFYIQTQKLKALKDQLTEATAGTVTISQEKEEFMFF